jgi:tRNA A-37 threonylcarbamoyl transferase component Bud32
MENLLLEIVSKEKKKYIFVAPYPRYGNSGSKLYLIYYGKEMGCSVPFLLKTFKNKKKFDNESKGMSLIKDVYTFAQSIKSFKPKRGELYGILTENFNAKNNTINNPITLADVINNKKESEIIKIVKRVFADFYQAKRVFRTDNCKIKGKYSRYLGKRADRTRKIIEKLTDDSIKEKKIHFYKQNITNPVYIIDNMVERTTITNALIHGDLHQNNIVLNDYNEPRIIDFEWSCENDIYIDFSLLEISVRYWNSALLLNHKFKYALEEMFLSENFDGNIDGCKLDKNAKRMVMIVSEIRRQCKEIIKDKYDFKHHLLSQFLILYGLQSHINEYNPLLVIPFLAKLGDKLIKSGYVNEA